MWLVKIFMTQLQPAFVFIRAVKHVRYKMRKCDVYEYNGLSGRVEDSLLDWKALTRDLSLADRSGNIFLL